MAVKTLLSARGEGSDGAEALDLQACGKKRKPHVLFCSGTGRIFTEYLPVNHSQAYVELQQEVARVMRAHRAALASSRRFWRLLVRTTRAPSLREKSLMKSRREK